MTPMWTVNYLHGLLLFLFVFNTPTRMVSSLIPPARRSSSTRRTWSKSTATYQHVADQDNQHDEEGPLRCLEVSSSYSSFSSFSELLRGGDSSIDRQKIIMAVALFSTYFSVMGAKCALPSTFDLITSPDSGLKYAGDPQRLISIVLTISTGGIALGKFVLGPVIDKFGGVACLKVALSMLMGALGLIASTKSFAVFAMSWIMVDFIFSSCWAACLNAIHHTFPEEDWASRVGLLAVAGRVGNASSFFAFASVLQWSQQRQSQVASAGDGSWRLVFWVSSLLQLIPLIMFTYFERVVSKSQSADSQYEARDTDSLQSAPPTRIKDSLKVLRGESRNISFWMHLISRSCLMIVASFLLFVPSYMTNAFGMTSADGARVGSLFALGSLLSVSFGAKKFSASSARSKIVATILLLGSLLGCSLLQIAHISGAVTMSAIGGAISMFVWGVAFSIPFYIPPSMYALRRGGRESSATIADAFDFFGFMMLAWFNGFVASRQQDVLASWLAPFVVLTGCSVTSLLALVVAIATEDTSRS